MWHSRARSTYLASLITAVQPNTVVHRYSMCLVCIVLCLWQRTVWMNIIWMKTVNWNRPSVLSEYLGPLSPRLHDLRTDLTCLSANCLHSAVYSRISQLLSAARWGHRSRVHLLSRFTDLLSVWAPHIEVYQCHAEEEDEKEKKLPSSYWRGSPCGSFPCCLFKLLHFCECVCIFLFCVTTALW